MTAAPCIGCGRPAPADVCDACERAELAHVDAFGTWPVGVSATPPALHAIEAAVREYLFTRAGSTLPESVQIELANAANSIRAYLQHIAADRIRERAAPTDEDLLA